jgi:hypothetical protein
MMRMSERMRVDLEELQEERGGDLLALINELKKHSDEAKQRLKDKRNKPENSKAFGQPVRVTINDVLKRHGIDRGAHFGGALEGNGCRKLLSAATDILEEVKAYVLGLPPEQQLVGTDEEVSKVCLTHWELMTNLDGFLSGT